MVREISAPMKKYTGSERNNDDDEEQIHSDQEQEGTANDDTNISQIFVVNGEPLKIWLSLIIPTRATFKSQIEVQTPPPTNLAFGGLGFKDPC